jgi:transposase
MATEGLAMRKVREILRLRFFSEIKSSRTIAQGAKCSKTTVNEYLCLAERMGIRSWSQIEDLSEQDLEILLFPNDQKTALPSVTRGRPHKAQPDWSKIHDELRNRHVTLTLLWQEYREENSDGLMYSQFGECYREWKKKLSLVMRQTHSPGEKAFIDFSGDGLRLTDPETGQEKAVQIFVAALGASSYTFACAVASQTIADWVECNRRFLRFIGGVPAILVPDNLKSGVIKADRYEPILNPVYQEMAEYYGTCIIPARVRKPKDKAKAENAVLQTQRWILAILRRRTFYSLAEMNQAIAECLKKLNDRVMRGYGKSRRELFEFLDQPALKRLPEVDFEFADWKQVRLGIDYHIRYDDHFYSAPSTLANQELLCRATAKTIEIFFKGKRRVSHIRSFVRWGKSTNKEHMPSHHRAYAEWTPERIISWASSIGKSTAELVEKMIQSKAHPEQAYQAALGVISLSKKFGSERVEKASLKALKIQSPYYKTLKTMLKNRMEEVGSEPYGTTPKPSPEEEQLWLLTKENVRGPSFYH